MFCPIFLIFIFPYLETSHLLELEMCDQYKCKWSNHLLDFLFLCSFVLRKAFVQTYWFVLFWAVELFKFHVVCTILIIKTISNFF